MKNSIKNIVLNYVLLAISTAKGMITLTESQSYGLPKTISFPESEAWLYHFFTSYPRKTVANLLFYLAETKKSISLDLTNMSSWDGLKVERENKKTISDYDSFVSQLTDEERKHLSTTLKSFLGEYANGESVLSLHKNSKKFKQYSWIEIENDNSKYLAQVVSPSDENSVVVYALMEGKKIHYYRLMNWELAEAVSSSTVPKYMKEAHAKNLESIQEFAEEKQLKTLEKEGKRLEKIQEAENELKEATKKYVDTFGNKPKEDMTAKAMQKAIKKAKETPKEEPKAETKTEKPTEAPKETKKPLEMTPKDIKDLNRTYKSLKSDFEETEDTQALKHILELKNNKDLKGLKDLQNL